MSMHSEEDGPTLASAMRQAAYSTYWAAVSAIIGSQVPTSLTICMFEQRA